MHHISTVFLAATLGFAAIATANEEFPSQDSVPNAVDSPLLARYSGSTLVGYQQKKYDETSLIASPYADTSQGPHFAHLLRLEGKITRIAYVYRRDRSGLEVMRNYKSAIQAAGMSIVFSCDKDACGGTMGNNSFGGDFYEMKVSSGAIDFPSSEGDPQGSFNYGRWDERYLLAAAKRSDGATTYIAIYVVAPTTNSNGGVYLEVVEPEQMETGKVAANLTAAQMATAISGDGRVALYGLNFDADKADIRADSKPALDEIAKLLQHDPTLKVYVVGHTDNQGLYPHNLDLSQRRAESIVKQLVTAYHIDPARLVPKGVASMAPVATNDTDSGRARNRRVELVKV
jgi:outer membrane protein OmpA-like peptidoglycan-associated protein